MSDSLVLCYHGVSEGWPCDIAITPAQLESQVSWFLARGYRPVTFAEAVERPAGKTIAVTFDDAYRSVLELGLPVLSRLGVVGTMFVPTDFVGLGEPRGWDGTSQWVRTEWAREILVMDWDEVAQLRAAGWEIGSHTRTHPHLPRLGDAELADELRGSRAALEDRLGVPCPSLAYPYGETDLRVARATEAAGYRAAGGLLPDRLLSERRRLLFPRISVGLDWSDETVQRRARPAYRRAQQSRAWPLVTRALSVKSLVARLRAGGGE